MNHKQLPTNSKILGFSPRLNSEGMMRPDGRLTYAEFLPCDVRYPIILPHKNWVTNLIVKYHHKLRNHFSGYFPLGFGLFQHEREFQGAKESVPYASEERLGQHNR